MYKTVIDTTNGFVCAPNGSRFKYRLQKQNGVLTGTISVTFFHHINTAVRREFDGFESVKEYCDENFPEYE